MIHIKLFEEFSPLNELKFWDTLKVKVKNGVITKDDAKNLKF